MTTKSSEGDYLPDYKAGYSLVFSDEFSAATLDRSKWLPYHLPQWSSRGQAAAQYSISDGRLQLQIRQEQPPWCPKQDGTTRVSSLQTGCFSGPVGSSIGQHQFKSGLKVVEEQPVSRLFTPQYGYFETRLKAVPIPGYMVAFWMIGFEDEPERSAEICICEIFGSTIANETSQINYGLHPFGDPAIKDEFYKESMSINAADFHVYAAEWTPTHVDFFVDNAKTRTVYQSPDYALQLMLGIYEIPDLLQTASPPPPWPKTFEVDYVRAYERLGR